MVDPTTERMDFLPSIHCVVLFVSRYFSFVFSYYYLLKMFFSKNYLIYLRDLDSRDWSFQSSFQKFRPDKRRVPTNWKRW